MAEHPARLEVKPVTVTADGDGANRVGLTPSKESEAFSSHEGRGLLFERTMVTGDPALELSLEALNGPILPVQYFEPIKQRKLLSGERRLLLAVLEDAVRSYLSNMNRPRREQRAQFAEVRRWFYGSGGSQGLFAFESICDLLEINANIFRKRLGSINLRDLPSRRRPVQRTLLTGQRPPRSQSQV